MWLLTLNRVHIMYIKGLLVLLTAATAGRVPVADSAFGWACPAENPKARSIVQSFLTSSSFAEARQRFAMGSVNPANLRVLSDAQDSSVCQLSART